MMEGTFLLATSLSNTERAIHILVFRDSAEVGMWDVACCGDSLGDYAPVGFAHDEGAAIESACPRCFDNFGSDLAVAARS